MSHRRTEASHPMQRTNLDQLLRIVESNRILEGNRGLGAARVFATVAEFGMWAGTRCSGMLVVGLQINGVRPSKPRRGLIRGEVLARWILQRYTGEDMNSLELFRRSMRCGNGIWAGASNKTLTGDISNSSFCGGGFAQLHASPCSVELRQGLAKSDHGARVASQASEPWQCYP